MTKRILCVFLSMLAVNLVFATEVNWQLIKTLNDQKYFIDRDSVRVEDDSGERVSNAKKEGERRKVRSLASYNDGQTTVSGEKFLSESYVDIFSCSDKTTTLISSTKYAGRMGTGKIIRSSKIGSPIPMKIAPGSVNEFLSEMLVCN